MFDNTLINVTSALMIFQTLLKKNLKKSLRKIAFITFLSKFLLKYFFKLFTKKLKTFLKIYTGRENPTKIQPESVKSMQIPDSNPRPPGT